MNYWLNTLSFRLQYFARGLQVYIRQLRLALQGKTGEALKTEEVRMLADDTKVVSPMKDFVGSCWDLGLPDLHNKSQLHRTPNDTFQFSLNFL